MMPEKARMPPIDRSNMPLIISTIMPQARMPVCAVSSRTTAAFAGAREGGRLEDRHADDQRDDQDDQQQLPVRRDADEQVLAARAGSTRRLSPARRSDAAGASMRRRSCCSFLTGFGGGELEDADLGRVAASSSPATRPSDMTTMRCASASTSGRSEDTTRSARPLGGEVAQDAVDVGLGADIDAARRLVDDQDARLARQPFGEQHLLLVAAGQVAHLAVDARRRDPQLARR